MATAVESDAFVQGSGAPAPVSKWQGFLTFLYDSKEGTVLGRTGKSWLQITIFYIIFYGVLAAFFAVLLILFLQTLDPNAPKWQAKEGIIGDTPGLGFRPNPPDSGSTLIWVKPNDNESGNSSRGYVSNLDDFLSPYEAGAQVGEHIIPKCSNDTRPNHGDKTCKISLTDLGPCTKELQYGYQSGQPCVLLKLNRIFGWVPDTYPEFEKIPEDVKKFYARPGSKTTLKPTDPLGQIYMTCDGEDPVDREHIGPVRLHPPTIPAYYFPFFNQKGYLSPIVMVQFLNPSPGLLINVECKAWAVNIKHSRTDRLGQVHFEILVDR